MAPPVHGAAAVTRIVSPAPPRFAGRPGFNPRALPVVDTEQSFAHRSFVLKWLALEKHLKKMAAVIGSADHAKRRMDIMHFTP
jgi:hypothetical protein